MLPVEGLQQGGGFFVKGQGSVVCMLFRDEQGVGVLRDWYDQPGTGDGVVSVSSILVGGASCRLPD